MAKYKTTPMLDKYKNENMKTAKEIEGEKAEEKDEITIDITSSEDEAKLSESSSDPKSQSDIDSDNTPVRTKEEELTDKVAELEEKLLLSMADLENFKKRSARQFDQIARTANDKLFGELLDISDNLDRALAHTDEKADTESIRKGTQMIANQFHDLLSRYNIVPLESVGKKFDASKHEALMTVASDEYPDGTVALEIARGYMMNDRVLRFAKVGVSKGPEKTDDNKTNNSDSNSDKE